MGWPYGIAAGLARPAAAEPAFSQTGTIAALPGVTLTVRLDDGLQVFLEVGRVELDSNAVENRIRSLALTRKNALFAGHDDGSAEWGRIAALIEAAKMNGVEPYAYLKATLEAISPPDIPCRGSTNSCNGLIASLPPDPIAPRRHLGPS